MKAQLLPGGLQETDRDGLRSLLLALLIVTAVANAGLTLDQGLAIRASDALLLYLALRGINRPTQTAVSGAFIGVSLCALAFGLLSSSSLQSVAFLVRLVLLPMAICGVRSLTERTGFSVRARPILMVCSTVVSAVALYQWAISISDPGAFDQLAELRRSLSRFIALQDFTPRSAGESFLSSSVFDHSNEYGAIQTLLIMVLILYLYQRLPALGGNRMTLIAVISIGSFGLIASGSRSSLLALLVFVSVNVLARVGDRRVTVGLIGAVLAGLVILTALDLAGGGQDQVVGGFAARIGSIVNLASDVSTSARIETQKDVLEAILESPAGIGSETVVDSFGAAHNSLLFLFASVGLLGGSMILLTLYWSLAEFRQNSTAIGAQGVGMATAVLCLTEDRVRSPIFLVLSATVLGIVSGVGALRRA